jgi:acyl-CoA reductase-like NAD-dependent aldehyde dehydrogenase
VYEQFIELVRKNAELQVLGDPSDPATTMGPLISAEQRDRVLGYVDIGNEEGTLVSGGKDALPENLQESLFLPPTIFVDVTSQARLAQEEVFGPVLSVISFTDEQDAIAIANSSRYGLAGGVWTRDITRAFRVVKAVRTGKMFVNSYNTAGIDDMPHGGYKESGFGREFGTSGLEEFLELKTVQIRLT